MSEQIVCVACGEPLGSPEDEIGEDGHFTLVEGRPDNDPRVRCGNTGQIRHPESVGVPKTEYQRGSGGDGEEVEPENSQPQTQQQERQPPPQHDKGLDLDEEIEPLDLLHDVLANPLYELSEPQIGEVESWAEEFDEGMIPPDSLEQILGLMDGVSQQKAQLMRQKYELKLQRWMRKRSEDGGGPPIGMLGRRSGRSPSPIDITGGGSGTPSPSRTSGGMQRSQQQNIEEREQDPERVIDRRKDKARDRVDEFLDSFAENVGNDVGTFYTDAKQIVKTALLKKAEDDPDWVLEKLEHLGGFEIVQEIMAPSDAKRAEQQQQRQSQPEVDREIDNAVNRVAQNNQQRNQQQRPPQQQQQSPPQQEQRPNQQQNNQQQPQESQYMTSEDIPESEEPAGNSMERLIEKEEEQANGDEEQSGEDEMFEDTFGQLQEQ